MPASLFDMRKYASTGIATDGMTAFDKKGIEADTKFYFVKT